MPPEGSSWERRAILRQKRYERGEKLSFARGRRDFHPQGSAAFALPPPPPPPPPPPSLAFLSSNRSTWPNARQGRTRLFSEDSAHGFISSLSSDVLTQEEKIYEDDNSGFRMEGRCNERNRELLESGVPAQRKIYEDEISGFRMEGRYNKRAREPMGSNPSSTDALVQGKCYEDDNLGFCMEGRFNKRCRELVGSDLSSCRPLLDGHAQEKNAGFYLEGMHNKRGRDLIIGSGLSFSYLHRDKKLKHWDSGIITGRHDTASGKSVDQTSLHSSHLYFDSESSWDQMQSQERYRKIGLGYVSTDNIAQKGGPENDFENFSRDCETKFDRYGSSSSSDSFVGDAINPQQDHPDGFISRKPLKWIRSGKCSWSPMSGQAFGSKEPKGELNKPHDIHGNMSPHDSTSRFSASVFDLVPDDETHSRKKQRLGWGQGLAKYEKQKVEGSEDENSKSDLIQCADSLPSKVEKVSHPLETNVGGRSPKLTGSSGYLLPGTPYSINCISSPDEHVSSFGAGTNDVAVEEKACHRVFDNSGNGGHVAGGSPVVQHTLPTTGSDSIFAESSLEFEHLEEPTFISMNSLRTDGVTSNFSGSEMSLTADKVLSLKNDILQKLETTEHDIEKYETEIRLLNSGTELDADGDCILGECTEAEDKDLCDRCLNASDVDIQVSFTMPTSYDGFVRSSLDLKADKVSSSCAPLERHLIKGQVLILEENTTDMKFVGSQGSQEDFMNKQSMKCQLLRTKGSQADSLVVRSQKPVVLEISDCKNVTGNNYSNPWETQSILVEEPIFACIENNAGVSVQLRDMVDNRVSASSIYAANKELARETSESIERFLRTDIAGNGDFLLSDVLDLSMWKQMHERNMKQIQAKIADQRHFLRFKERALALKFRVLRQLWKDDQHPLSPRRQRARAQKGSEINCHLNGRNQKYRLSPRSRFASPGTLTCTPTKETIELAGKLMSDCQDRPCRSVLKMPALVLDEIENHVRFITWNGLVDDPIAVEKERTMINPWTPEERNIFLEKFSMFGKNFRKIASFLEHKTVADCIEFYYKNQKLEIFEKLKKMRKVQRERDCYCVSTYLATAGNNRHRDSNAVSLDILNAASIVASCASDQAMSFQDTLQKYAGRPSMGTRSYKRIVDDHYLESERECTAAADVLAGICCALSSEAVSSCITGGADQSEVLNDNSFSRSFLKENNHPLISETLHNIEIHYSSEESCEEVYVDWTDDERAFFVNAVTMFGRDFGNISRYVGSRTEDQCKTFYSKACKRLGLDELVPRQSYAPAKGNHGSDDDERGGLVGMGTGLCVTDSSAKMAATSDANFFNSDQLNIKIDTLIEGAHKIEVQDNQVEFFREDARASQYEETEQNTGIGALQDDMEINFKEAATSPVGEHFLNDKSLTDTRGTLKDIQHNEYISKVQEADVSSCNKDRKIQSMAESYDKSCDLCGNGAELKVYKTGETVVHSALKMLSIDCLERCHGILDTEKAFIDGKAGSKRLEDDVSLTNSVSSKKDDRLPCNLMEESYCMHVTSGCRWSLDTTELPALVPCQNSLNNLEVLSSSSMLKATMDESTTAQYVSGDVSSNEKYLIGSALVITGNDPFGMSEVMSSPNSSASMRTNNEILDPKYVSSGSMASSLDTKEIPRKVYLGDKASCAVPLPIDRSDSQLKHKSSDVFSQISQPMDHYMQPEVVAWQQKQQVPSTVVSKSHDGFQGSVLSSMVRNQKLENDMAHHYCSQGESQNQIKREFCLGRMPPSIQQSDTPVSELSSRHFQGHQLQDHGHIYVDACEFEILRCLSDSEWSSLQFGGHRLKLLHTEAYDYRNLDAYQQESLQQSAFNSEVLSQVLGGHQLQEINLEDVCRRRAIDACRQATHQQLAQGCSNLQLKILQQHQVIKQNFQENVLQTLENATKEHLALAAEFPEKPVSKQLIWDQRKQSSEVEEQYQLLCHCQQKYKAHNVICDDHMLLQKAERQVDHHETGQFWQTKSKLNPRIKPVYSLQSSSPSPTTDFKSLSESEEQRVQRGNVKLFGQILQSHSASLSKLLPLNEDVIGSTASLQGSQKVLPVLENDEQCHAVAKLSSEWQSVTKYVRMYSEGTVGKAKYTTSQKLKKSRKDLSQCFTHQGPGSKNNNFTKVVTGHSVQEFGGQNLGFWEDNSAHNPCNSTGILHFTRDPDSQCKSMLESLTGSTCVEQAIKANKYKGISLDSSMIPGWHSSEIQDMPYLIKDPLIKDYDYHPSGYKELGNGYFFTLGLKQPEFLIELKKREAVLDLTPSRQPGRRDTVQSIFPFECQMRNNCGHMGYQTGGAMPRGSFVSDPVAAFRMQFSAAEEGKSSLQHLHLSGRDQDSGRGDYGS